MKYFKQFLLLMLPILLMASAFDGEVTPTDILAGKYKSLLANNPEYVKNTTAYKNALHTRKTCLKKLDSLFTVETLHLWPVEDQQKLKTLSKLAKNNTAGDVYEQLKEYGSEYAFNLNKIITLLEVYSLERKLILAGQDIEKIENWAATLAAAAQYFNDDFEQGKLTKDAYYYGNVLAIEKDLQEALRKYKNDLSQYPVKDKFAYFLFRRWKNYYSAVKHSAERESLYKILQESYERPHR